MGLIGYHPPLCCVLRPEFVLEAASQTLLVSARGGGEVVLGGLVMLAAAMFEGHASGFGGEGADADVDSDTQLASVGTKENKKYQRKKGDIHLPYMIVNVNLHSFRERGYHSNVINGKGELGVHM